MADNIVNEPGGSGKPIADASRNLPAIVTGGLPFQATETETRAPRSLSEVIGDFSKSRDEHRDFKKAGMVLFDQHLLPGFTPHRSLELLIEGMQLDPERFAPMLDPTSAHAVKLGEGFPYLMDELMQQINDQAVVDIWNVPEIDDFMKIGLQWEIQREDQRKTREIEESATKQAEVLRKLNESLLQNPGADVLIMYEAGITRISGLTSNDGSGLHFAHSKDSQPSYKAVELRGKSAFKPRKRDQPIERADGLIIPFGCREIFAEAWSQDTLENHVRRFDGIGGREFKPEGNNFPCIAIGDEVKVAIKEDRHVTGKVYDSLKSVRDGA